MKRQLLRAKDLIVQTYHCWDADHAPQMAAALSYYTTLSIAPLLLIVIGVAGLFLGEDAARGEILDQLSSLVGQGVAKTIEEILKNLNRSGQDILATMVGIVTLLIGATGVFAELQQSLNRIWQVRFSSRGGVWPFFRRRLISFSMILVIGFLLLVSLVLTAMLSAAMKYLGNFIPGSEFLWQSGSTLLSFAVIACLFSALFKVLPDAKISWRDVWVGGLITAGFFVLGKTLIGVYLGKSSVASTFGAAGSLVLLLVWIYYSAQIFFFGAEFTKVYAKRVGDGIVPKAGAQMIGSKVPAPQENNPKKTSGELLSDLETAYIL